MSLTATAATTAAAPSNGARLVSVDGRVLPLRGTELKATAGQGAARVVLAQTFANPHAEPLRVSYQLPLPADGAVAGFAFTLDGQKSVGRVEPKKVARRHFEEALIQGRTAALLEQDRTSLFEQEVGNVPPGAEVLVEVTVDQPLAWLEEGAWEWRFPTVVAPRYLGAGERTPDANRVTVEVADGPVDAAVTLSLMITDALTGAVTSSSHGLLVRPADGDDDGGSDRGAGTADGDDDGGSDRGAGTADGGDAGARGVEVGLRAERGAALDRDVVVRWPVAALEPGVTLQTARPLDGPRSESAYGLLCVVPPTPDARPRCVARDLIVLIDTSGSQMGEPMAQSRRVTTALIDTLDERDQLQMIEFSSRARTWKRWAKRMTESNKAKARRWVAALTAGGCTEMAAGIRAALAPLGPKSQRQVLIVTDGLIGFEQEIIAGIRTGLPRSSRVHTLGVGTSVNRTLTGGAARAGGGTELICAPGEDIEPIVRRLLARTSIPLVVDLELSGSALRSAAPARLPDLFAGAPARIALELNPGGGSLHLRGRTAEGRFDQRVEVAPIRAGDGSPAIPVRWARERVEDLEMERAAGEDARAIDRQIESLGVDLQLATRLTSWIAIAEHPTVDPSGVTRHERQPHMLPHQMSAEGLGLRRAVLAVPGAPPAPQPASAPTMTRAGTVRAAAKAGVRSRSWNPFSRGGGAGDTDDFETPTFGGAGAAPDQEAFDTPTYLRRDGGKAERPASEAPSPADADVPGEEGRYDRLDRSAVFVLDEDELYAGPDDSGVLSVDDEIGFVDAEPETTDHGAEPRGDVAADESPRAFWPAPVPLQLVGRIVPAGGERVVVEVVAPSGGLEWDPDHLAEEDGPGSEVVVLLADGSIRRGWLDLGTSAAQSVDDGAVIRIVVVFDGAAPRADVIAVEGNGWRVRIA